MVFSFQRGPRPTLPTILLLDVYDTRGEILCQGKFVSLMFFNYREAGAAKGRDELGFGWAGLGWAGLGR